MLNKTNFCKPTQILLPSSLFQMIFFAHEKKKPQEPRGKILGSLSFYPQGFWYLCHVAILHDWSQIACDHIKILKKSHELKPFKNALMWRKKNLKANLRLSSIGKIQGLWNQDAVVKVVLLMWNLQDKMKSSSLPNNRTFLPVLT